MLLQKFAFRYYLNLGEGRFADIFVNQLTNPYIQASKIAKKYDFSNQVTKAIADSIQEQIKYETNQFKKMHSNSFLQFKQSSKTDVLIQNERKPPLQSQQFKIKKHKKSVMKIKKYITEEVNQQQFQGYPFQKNNLNIVEDHALSQIKISDSNTLNSSQELLKMKIDKLLDRQSSKSKQNSRVSNSGQKRHTVFQNLYKKHKQIEQKKQLKRKQSFESLTFKPQINKFSKKIVQDNRRIKIQSAKNSQSKSKHLTTQNSFKNVSQNGKNIGNQNFWKKQITFKIKQGQQDINTPQKCKILPKSQELVQKCRKQSLKQIFDELLSCRKNSQKRLFFSDINFGKLTQKQKLLLPIFQELKHFSFGINQKQFIEGCLRYMQNIPQNQKNILGSKRKQKTSMNKVQNNKNNSSKKLKTECFESNFSSILKDKLNIYERGNIFRKKSAQKLSKLKQNQSSLIMKNCTFRPSINPSHK